MLQRNLILSHCCGVGEALDIATTRLMMVLKLLSLGRGRLGGGLGHRGADRSDAGKGRHTGGAGSGLGRGVGRSGAAGPYGGRDDRRGRGLVMTESVCRA